jgi:hypothetical protein
VRRNRDVRRSVPQIAEYASEHTGGDHEQHRAGVLGERSDHARGQTAGERGKPSGVAADGREQAPVVAHG